MRTVNMGMEYAKATQAMEGLKISEKQEQLVLEFVNQKISEEEFRRRARELANE